MSHSPTNQTMMYQKVYSPPVHDAIHLNKKSMIHNLCSVVFYMLGCVEKKRKLTV